MKHSEVFGDVDPKFFNEIEKVVVEKYKKKSLIACVNVKDLEKINEIPNFRPISQYIDKENVVAEEWGKIDFGDIEIKLYASSEIRYYVVDECKKI